MQRATGEVRLAVRLRDGATALERLRQSGSAKAHLPRSDGCEAVLLNTAGGLAGGDRFSATIAAGPGVRLAVATQAAERVYRSLGEDAEVVNRLEIDAGARIDWLPQETILFEGGRLRRSLTVEMASDATLLAVEPLILGRAAMGERVTQGALHDRWRIRRAGRLIHADDLRLAGDLGALDAAAGFAGMGACALVLLAGPGAEDLLAPARAALAGAPGTVRAGASAWNGRLAARILAPGGAALRAALIPLIERLRPGPPPRVWAL